jgi:hypothetical protein
VVFHSTNKTDRQDITEILLKVALNTTNLKLKPMYSLYIVWYIKDSALLRVQVYTGFTVMKNENKSKMEVK